MRSNHILVLLPALAALALGGCKKEGVEGPLAGCQPVSFASFCSEDAQCCSFGCVYGTCMPNPLENGVCRTDGDCQAPRLCVGERCTSAVQCVPGGAPCSARVSCCSGQCGLNGLCGVDRAPTAVAGPNPGAPVPFRIPIQLTNASTDPDTGTAVGLSYSWTVLARPAGSVATFAPSSTYPTPTFTPDVASAVEPYHLRLTASNIGGAGADDIVFYAINTVPEIDMPPDVPVSTYVSRNVSITTTATVRDADGGPITCTWSKKGPTASVYTTVSGPTACAGGSGVAATGTSTYTLNEDEAGTWELRLTVDDSVNTFAKSRFISVQNDPPVASAGPKRYGNLGLGAIPIDGTATDVNGDVTNGNVGDADFTWTWNVTARPVGSTIPLGYQVGIDPSVMFNPDAEGTFTLTLTADDGHGGPRGDFGTSTVDVQVDPYILPLGEVADAKYVDGADRVVLVETNPGSSYQLKIVNPAALLDPIVVVTLAARPTTVALNAGGTEAIVGEAGGRWQKVTGIQATPVVATTVPATTGIAMPADVVDIAHGGACAFGVTAGGSVYRLELAASAAPFYTAVGLCPTCTATEQPAGMRAVTATATVELTTGPWLWLLQTGSGRLARYGIHGNCDLRTPVLQSSYGTLQGTSGLWLSPDAADLYTTRASVFDAVSPTLTSRQSGLPVIPDHLKTTSVSSSIVGAVAQYTTTALATFARDATPGSAFAAGATKPFPILGVNGNPKSNYGRFAFVKSGGGGYFAIVRANIGTDAAPIWKWGLVNLGP